MKCFGSSSPTAMATSLLPTLCSALVEPSTLLPLASLGLALPVVLACGGDKRDATKKKGPPLKGAKARAKKPASKSSKSAKVCPGEGDDSSESALGQA